MGSKLEDEEEEEVLAAPEAIGYEFQSHKIIDMLKKLEGKFTDELTELQKKEMESEHAFELVMTDLKAQIATAEEDMADALDDLEQTKATKAEDEKYLADLKAECGSK